MIAPPSPCREVELKLELAPRDAAAFRRIRLLGRPEQPPTELTSTYFDTPEGSLRQAGISLRIRSSPQGHVQTVKANGHGNAGFSDRPEWEAEVTRPELDLKALAHTPAARFFEKKKSRRSIAGVSKVRVRRTAWCLARGGSEIEVVLDEGEAASGARQDPICEIELELKKGESRDLFDLARELGRRLPLRLGVLTKSERGFRLLDKRRSPVSKAERIELTADMSVAEAFAAIVAACLRHFRLNEPLVLAGNAAALHQVRVAMRRLRSALTLFKPAVAGPGYERLRRELRWFTDQLGEARNIDVFLAGASNDDPDLRTRLREDRRAAYAKVAAALSGPRLPRAILELVGWAETGEWRELAVARQPIASFAGKRLDRQWKRVRRQGGDLAILPAEQRHRLRIEIKKLRYATEFFASLAPEPRRVEQKRFLKELEALQDRLGELNDIETARLLAPEAEFDPGQAATLIARAQHLYDALREQGAYWRFPRAGGRSRSKREAAAPAAGG